MMADTFYTASLSRTQGRSTWAIIFRHPKRTDPTTGKEGLRVRQSLKTDDDHEAAKLRDDMNVLLSSPHLWDLGAREQALATLDPASWTFFTTSSKVARPTSWPCARRLSPCLRHRTATTGEP